MSEIAQKHPTTMIHQFLITSFKQLKHTVQAPVLSQANKKQVCW